MLQREENWLWGNERGKYIIGEVFTSGIPRVRKISPKQAEDIRKEITEQFGI